MFEETPSNLPVEDILGGVEKSPPPPGPRPAVGAAPTPGAPRPPGASSPFKPAAPRPPSAPGAQATAAIEEPRAGFGRIIRTIVVVVAALGIVGGAGYFAFTRFVRAPAEEPAANTPAAPAVTPPAPEPEPEPPAPPPPADSDGDGLTDLEEAGIGTDPNAADTDLDGLLDGDEVTIYRTNPRNPDTDGDSYPDGTEVRGGYNPNGQGRLFQVPTSTP